LFNRPLGAENHIVAANPHLKMRAIFNCACGAAQEGRKVREIEQKLTKENEGGLIPGYSLILAHS
jgi:hypothetical protein